MARRQRKTLADDLVDVASLLPWWLCLILALISYLVLHDMAMQRVITSSVAPGQIGDMVTASMKLALAQVGQYLLPLLFVVSGFVSYARRKRGQQLLSSATGAAGASAISGMTWREFELLIAEGFRSRGFVVKDKGGQGPDGGVDLVLLKGNERFLVQCKQWRALKVGVTVVRELYGVMSAEGATGGIVVTSGAFTDDAKEFANGRNIKLVDGPLLREILQSGRAASASTTPPRSNSTADQAMPVCPRCGSSMVVREAKKGPSAGNKFLGCSKFPSCKGTLPL